MIISFIAFLVLVSAMAIGTIIARKPIKGSCGGLANIGITGDCMICGRSQNQQTPEVQDALFYDATCTTQPFNQQRSHTS